MLMDSDGESYDAAGMTLAIAPACTYRSQKNKAHFTCTSVHLLLANHHSKKEEPEREREGERGGEWLCSFILTRSSSHILNISLSLWLCSEANTSVLLTVQWTVYISLILIHET